MIASAFPVLVEIEKTPGQGGTASLVILSSGSDLFSIAFHG